MLNFVCFSCLTKKQTVLASSQHLLHSQIVFSLVVFKLF